MDTNIQPNNNQPLEPEPVVPSPNVPAEPTPPAESKKISVGLIFGIVVISVVIIGAAVAYILFTSSFGQPQNEESFVSVSPSPSQVVGQELPMSEEDSTASISQELEDTTIYDIDSQFEEIDADLNQL